MKNGLTVSRPGRVRDITPCPATRRCVSYQHSKCVRLHDETVRAQTRPKGTSRFLFYTPCYIPVQSWPQCSVYVGDLEIPCYALRLPSYPQEVSGRLEQEALVQLEKVSPIPICVRKEGCRSTISFMQPERKETTYTNGARATELTARS